MKPAFLGTIKKNLFGIITAVLSAGVLLGFLFSADGIASLARISQNMRYEWLLVALAMAVAAWFLEGIVLNIFCQGDLSAMEISILLLYRDGGNIIQRSHSLFHRRAANADLFYAPVGYGYGSSQFHYRNENSGVSDNSGAVFVGYGCVDASFLSDQCEQFLFFNSSRAAVQQYIHYSDYFILCQQASNR